MAQANRTVPRIVPLVLFLGVSAGGCGGPGQKPPTPPAQEVEVGLPVLESRSSIMWTTPAGPRR